MFQRDMKVEIIDKVEICEFKKIKIDKEEEEEG